MMQAYSEQVRLMAEALQDRARSDAAGIYDDELEMEAFLTGVEWGARSTIRFLAQMILEQATAP